ncbi:hypothetical protein ACFQH5_16785 [Halomonas salifodinae]|uniref:Uncharacterized protein n=1 Tax=Halomonas salifodinae TaxID=438745 RepID=A0ABW2F283_9GAMM
MPAKAKPARPLFPRLGQMEADNFSNVLYTVAVNIEDTLLMAGATPGEDYTRLDLLRLAEPYVVERHRDSVRKGDGGLGVHYPATAVRDDDHD